MIKRQANYILCFILAFLLLSMSIPAFAARARNPKLTLNRTSVILTVGRVYNLKATITKANIKNKTVRWRSSNTKIAKVDASGKVTALKVGTVTISATTACKGLKATCKITVKSAKEDISSKFTDKNFRRHVYYLIGKSSSEPILYDDVKNIKKININKETLDFIGYNFGVFDSLNGIEYFTALTSLSCDDHNLTDLDLSKNTVLTTLHCANNKLTTLDISNNTALTELRCTNNKLTILDITKNTALTNLHCDSNKLITLDISNNTALTHLYCGSNKLTILDVSKNIVLTGLSCGDSQLINLDLSNNTALTHLCCDRNKLINLDLSNNTALTSLFCFNNQLLNVKL